MSKFANVLRGKRAESDPVKVPGYDDFVVLMTPLSGTEQIAAYAWGRKHAVEKDVADPKVGDSIYDLAVMAAVVYYGAIDPDSPPNARSRSFESPGELLDHMQPEAIVYLHQQHLIWQTECSPAHRKIESPDDLVAMVQEVAGPDGQATFMGFSPSTQMAFVLSTARRLWTLLSTRSTSTSGSSDSSRSAAKRARAQRKRQRRKRGSRG